MVLETRAMLPCTGRALVCLYCTRPKTIPMTQMASPAYISVMPLTPPRPPNFTVVRSGITMSDSLAYAPVEPSIISERRMNQYQCFLLLISLGVIIAKEGQGLPTHVLACLPRILDKTCPARST